jgi:hypothetical protein
MNSSNDWHQHININRNVDKNIIKQQQININKQLDINIGQHQHINLTLDLKPTSTNNNPHHQPA